MTLNPQAVWDQGYVRDVDGNIATIHAAPKPVSGPVGATLNDFTSCPVYGMSSVSVNFVGANTPTVAFQWSWDGGVSWTSMQMYASALLNLASTTLVFSGASYEGGLPSGATHFRVLCTIASGAGLTAIISPSTNTYRATQVVTIVTGSAVSLNAGGARVGIVSTVAQAIFADETTTPLAGAGTFVGAIRDLSTSGSGTSIIGANSEFKEFRALAASDVTGTLYVEVSFDQITWWRVASVATTLVGTNFVAQIQHLPVTRYARAGYINGAGAQSAFLFSTSRFAA